MSLFALPHVGRAGLGNALFPWARAELFARQSGARILAPRWGGLRLGPYLRREPDKRSYSGFFQASHYVSGVSRFVISTLGRRISERQVVNGVTFDGDRSRRPVLVEYSGIDGLFAPLLGSSAFIRTRLWDMTTEALRSTGALYGGPFIAMHVRRGDITRQGFTDGELNAVNQYTRLDWFVSMARAVRRQSALNAIPIVVFTDGDAHEVAELCSLSGVRLHERGPAIADLWTLAHAALLFGSGFSTFGMWASFLGGMPTIYAPGKLQQRVQAGLPGALEIELPAGEDIPESAIARL
jgi:hypothetical protein